MTASRCAMPSPTSERSRPDDGVVESCRSRRRSHSRRSVATWSLRERPVWSLPATAPIRRVSSISMLMWMSSSSGSHSMEPSRCPPRSPRSPSLIGRGLSSRSAGPLAPGLRRGPASRRYHRPPARHRRRWSARRRPHRRPVGAEKRPPQAFMPLGSGTGSIGHLDGQVAQHGLGPGPGRLMACGLRLERHAEDAG